MIPPFHAPSCTKQADVMYSLGDVHGIDIVAQLRRIEEDDDGRILMSVEVFPAQPTPVIDWIEHVSALRVLDVARRHGGDGGQVLKDVGLTGPRRALVVMRPGWRPQPAAVGVTYTVEGWKW